MQNPPRRVGEAAIEDALRKDPRCHPENVIPKTPNAHHQTESTMEKVLSTSCRMGNAIQKILIASRRMESPPREIPNISCQMARALPFSPTVLMICGLSNHPRASQLTAMESHDVLKQALRKTTPKAVAADLGVSLSLVYKWADRKSVV